MSHLPDVLGRHACLAQLTFGASCIKSEIIGCYKYSDMFREYSPSYLLAPSEVWRRQLQGVWPMPWGLTPPPCNSQNKI